MTMADCAAVGCSEPVLEVWRPRAEDAAPRFYYLVCEFHGLALRSDVRYRVEGDELRIDSPARLLDWGVTQAGGQSIVRVMYGDDLETVNVTFQADAAQLRELAELIVSTYSDKDEV
jgi:hypothetical protein